MSTPIDERTAWSLVRAVPPRLPEAGRPARVHHHPRPEIWLQVDASGLWEASIPATPEARDLFDIYLPLQVRPDFVIAQWGQSLDGRIATMSGQSHYVTGPADILRLHRLRALVDAVVVGARTVASDNPRLTVRHVEGTNPVRVVLDPRGQLDAGRHLFSDGAARTLVVRATTAIDVEPLTADVLALPVEANGFAPRAVLQALRDRGCRRVLVEGGGITVSRFLQADVLDRLHVTVAPLLVGSGRAALTLDPIASLDRAIRPRCRHFRLGDDILFDLDLTAKNQPRG